MLRILTHLLMPIQKLMRLLILILCLLILDVLLLRLDSEADVLADSGRLLTLIQKPMCLRILTQFVGVVQKHC